jgi:hypothetical protein
MLGLTMYALSSLATPEKNPGRDLGRSGKGKGSGDSPGKNKAHGTPEDLENYLTALRALSGFLSTPNLREYVDKALAKDILSSLKARELFFFLLFLKFLFWKFLELNLTRVSVNQDPSNQIRFKALSIFVQTVTSLSSEFFADAPELVEIIHNLLEYEMSIANEGDEVNYFRKSFFSENFVINDSSGFFLTRGTGGGKKLPNVI